jgi:transcriptional regulator
MYLPAHFEETRVETLHELIRAHPLGALVTLTPAGLAADHIPFEVDPDPAPFGTLRAHVARANPVWREAGDREVLVLFQGPETYISPSWYPTKQETARVVPTWNYAVVHAHGRLRAIEDREWLRAFVTRLTDRHEGQRADRWKVTDAPADYIDRQLGGIVGLEVPIGRLLGKWKVSQNRPAQDRAGVVEGLRRQDDPASAAMANLVLGAATRAADGKETR